MRTVVLALWPLISLRLGLFLSRLIRWSGVVLFCVVLAHTAGCHGGAASADPPPVSLQTGSDPPPSGSGSPPQAPQCPNGSSGPPPTCTTPPPPTSPDPPVTSPLPACPAGVTTLPPLNCTCPAADVLLTGGCLVPAPAPPPPPPAPTMSLTDTANADGTYTLSWQSVGALECFGAAGWPTSDELTPSGFVTTPVLTVTTSYSLVCSGPGGSATASITISIGAPLPPPGSPPPAPPGPPVLFTIAITADPPALIDSSGCPFDYNGVPCRTTLSIADNLGQESQDMCALNAGTLQAGSLGWIVGPFASDGPVVENISCTDTFGQTATNAITLTVSPPFIPPPDTFTVAGSDPYTFTWLTTSKAGAGGCSVEVFSSQGVQNTLSPGGTPAGSATSGFLSPSGSPWTATLYCSGAPDPGLPALTVSP